MDLHCRRPPNYVGARLRFLTHAFTRTHLKVARDMGEEELSWRGATSSASSIRIGGGTSFSGTLRRPFISPGPLSRAL